MQQEPKQTLANLAVTDELILDVGDVKRVAHLLNILMEVDFYLNRKPEGMNDD